MVSKVSSRRIALLAAALLSACAAAGMPGESGRRARVEAPSGAFGAYLAGRFAASEFDTAVAAENLLKTPLYDLHVESGGA